MTQNKRIVITGGIATGKSTASKMLQEMGYPVIDADRIARRMIEPGASAYREVVDTFGNAVVQSDGTIDRKALGRKVFFDPKQRMRLDAIVHPRVREEMEKQLQQYRKEPLVFLDIPLHYETQMWPELPAWLIYAPEPVQLERLMKRDGLSKEDAMARIRAQIDIEKKKHQAERVIENTSDLPALRKQLIEAVDDLMTN